MVWGIGNGILIIEDFARPIWFNPSLINAIASKSRTNFENLLNHYNIKDTHNARDCRGWSLLHITAEYDSAELAKYLINTLGFEVNVQNAHGQTALMIAVKKQHFATAKALLELNADISAYDIFGMNVLQIAVATDAPTFYDLVNIGIWLSKYWEIVGLILEKVNEKFSSDAEQIAAYLLKFSCPLTHVVFMANSEVLKIMIEKGSPINTTDRYSNRTALHLAVQYWKLDVVKILLDNKADVNILDYYRKTPVMCIYDNIQDSQKMPACEVELVEVLLQHKKVLPVKKVDELCLVDQMYPIFHHGSLDAIRAAVRENDDDLFLVKNKDKLTLLHVIAENLNDGIEKVIKGNKVDLNGTSRFGETALGHALEHANCNVVEYLISQGAITDAESASEYPARRSYVINTVLEGGVKRELQCMKLMLEQGMDQEILFRGIENTLSALDNSFPKDFFPLNSFAQAKPVLAQLAIRDSLEITTPEVIRKTIQKNNEAKTYYDSRVKELEEAKSSVMFKSVSVFEFLTASNKLISIFARDRSLAINLSEIITRLKLDPYYIEFLQKHSSKISKLTKSREKAEKIICECIGVLYACNTIVTRLIVDYMDDEDIEKLL